MAKKLLPLGTRKE